MGPIPFTAIAEYFRLMDIAGDFDEFAYIIRRLDNVYLELNAEDVKKSSEKGKTKSASTAKNSKAASKS